MITKAYIQEYGQGKLEPEHFDIKTTLETRGVLCELFTLKKLMRNQLIINHQTLVVGDHSVMAILFKKLKIDYKNDCYPKSLRPYLERTIWESTIWESTTKQTLVDCRNENNLPLFIKPKSNTKLFTGFLIHSNLDLYKLENISKSTNLYCSTIVNWISEYRIFVNQSKIVGIKNYEGEPTIQLDLKIVEKAIQDFENSEERTAAYAIDFGILNNGKTAFVEWNDGFALGSYNLDKEVYTNLVLARWQEILKNMI